MARSPARWRRCAPRRPGAGVKLAVEFLVLTATRSAEVRLSTWHEIDLDAMVWPIPAARMKTAREHRVPLCSRAVEILRQARRLRVDPPAAAPAGVVFPSRRGKVLRDQSLSGLMPKLGINAVPHGFRSSFRDWASERTDHPREVIEAALAHVVRNQTEDGLRAVGPVRAPPLADGRLDAASERPQRSRPGCTVTDWRA